MTFLTAQSADPVLRVHWVCYDCPQEQLTLGHATAGGWIIAIGLLALLDS